MIEQQHQSFQKLSREPEEIESSRMSRKSGQLHQPINHSSATPHTQIVRDPSYRGGFGVRERFGTWIFNCFKCNNTQNSFISNMDEAERRAPANLNEDTKKLLLDKILKLKICETSRLQLDPNVMHPFVKVHIINKNTGCYLLNLQKTEEPVVYHYQELTSYNKIEKKYQANQNDLILPFATSLCDFRTLGNSKGIWNQKFFINYPAHLLMHPDTLFLFQILDFNHQALLYRNDQDTFDKNNFYRVAWSFLRPVGISKTHLGRFRLEMYRYKYNNNSNQTFLNKSYIPDVYYDFLWNNHQKYEGYLTVQLNYCQKPKYRFAPQGTVPSNLFEEDHYDKKYLEKFEIDEIHPQQEKKKINQELLKFYRNRQICEIPKKLVYKLESDLRGCYRLKFIGNYLFAACSSKKNTSIKVFNLQQGDLVMTLKGHIGVIYKIQATPNQKLLITAGSDNKVKIWKIPQNTGEYIDEDESQQLILAQCQHSAAVYSISTVYQPLQDMLYILTCCYDGYIRLWQCKTGQKNSEAISKQIFINDFTRSAGKVYPTASAVSEGSYFLVGDSIGQIRVYDFSRQKLTLRCLLSPQELKGDAIHTIHILNKSHLMVQAKDNLIRHFELIGNKIRLHQTYSGGVYESQIVNCSISPDNKYLMAPSQAGKPLIWDVLTGNIINIDHLNLNIKGKLVCCDWHPKYNLVAISGFVDYCPIFVYGNVLSESQIKLVSAQIQ